MSLVNAGISSKLETRMWFFGETENQAKVALQKVEDEKKQSIETNIMGQKELGEVGQGKDMTGNNNNPNAEIKSPTEPSSKNSEAK
jgi:protocatechuate 3,4-dioxygenase beta subunit